jgi:xanthine dehydrogenase iron-sulfur cluster and FAD-binding subunit A
MRLLQIRARTDEDASCLVRELAVYSPRRLRRSILLELEERSETDLLAVLAAVETCLSANDIRSVRIELDGSTYAMAPPD